jgi:hypothetical protein
MPSIGRTDSFIRVRVISDPGGDPPGWVRDAWLGIEFDAIANSRKVLVGSTRGRWWARSRARGWVVPADVAVDALALAGQHEAAAWWHSSGLLGGVAVLVFRADSCVPVDATESRSE